MASKADCEPLTSVQNEAKEQCQSSLFCQAVIVCLDPAAAVAGSDDRKILSVRMMALSARPLKRLVCAQDEAASAEKKRNKLVTANFSSFSISSVCYISISLPSEEN